MYIECNPSQLYLVVLKRRSLDSLVHSRLAFVEQGNWLVLSTTVSISFPYVGQDLSRPMVVQKHLDMKVGSGVAAGTTVLRTGL